MMMRKMINARCLLVLLCLVLLLPLSAQDLSADLKSMYTRMYASADIHMTVQTSMYNKLGDATPASSNKGEITKVGEQYFYTMDKITMLSNQKYMIMVNNKEKLIIYQKLNGKSKKPSWFPDFEKDFLSADFDSILAKNDSVRYLGIENGSKQYAVYNSRAAIQRVFISINVQTGFFDKLTYYYNADYFKQNNKVEIWYRDVSFSPVHDPEMFSEKQFITVNKDQITVSPKYKSYELFNNESVY